MSNILSLNGAPVHSGEPNPRAIETLEDLLERAKSGEVVGIAAIALHQDHTSSYLIGGTIGGYSMLGAATIVVAELQEINRDLPDA